MRPLLVALLALAVSAPTAAQPAPDVAALVEAAAQRFEGVRGAPDTTQTYGTSGEMTETLYRAPLLPDSARSGLVTVTTDGAGATTARYEAVFGPEPLPFSAPYEARRAREARTEAAAAALADAVGAALPGWVREDPYGRVSFEECPRFFGRRVEVEAGREGAELTIEADTRPCLPAAERSLAAAAEAGDAAAVTAAIEAGTPLDTPDADSATPLARAAQGGHAAVVALLLDAGASPDGVRRGPDYEFFPPIHNAPAPVVALLLAAGANPDLPSTSELTALVGAALRGDAESAALLLDAGADPDARALYLDSQAALHFAVLESPAFVRLLLDAGADPNAQDHLGYAPLTTLASLDNAEAVGAEAAAQIARMLIAAGADVDLPSHPTRSYGWTPLMEAARTGNAAFVALLLDAGADAALRNTEGATALGAARASDWPEVVALLEAAGAPE